jgi:hypothetical protein
LLICSKATLPEKRSNIPRYHVRLAGKIQCFELWGTESEDTLDTVIRLGLGEVFLRPISSLDAREYLLTDGNDVVIKSTDKLNSLSHGAMIILVKKSVVYDDYVTEK